MIYFLVTTSLYNDCPIRKERYLNSIHTLKEAVRVANIQNYKIIIIENNGARPTYLDDLGCDVYYTNNNSLPVKNIGYKELQDVLDCIQHYGIQDDDFIVKMTGRYTFDDDSEFLNSLTKINTTGYDCIIRYGPYFDERQSNGIVIPHDCITGLIGMRCRYVKQIEKPNDKEWVEWKWGKASSLIPAARVCALKTLGIYICPQNFQYFLV